MRDGWRVADLAREALRNTVGRSARLLPAVALAVVLGSGTAAFVALETASLQDELDDLAERGRGVVSYMQANPDQPALVSRASCEALAGAPGVEAAGAVVPGGSTEVVPVGPDVPVQRASTTLVPGLADVDALVDAGLLDRAGPSDQRVLVGAEALGSARTPGLREGVGAGRSLTVPLRPDDALVERCVVVLDPLVAVDDVAATQIASLHVSGNAVVGTEALRATSDPVQAFLDRPSRFLPVLLGLLGAVTTAVTYRLRASELAVYRLSGTSARSLLVLVALETLLVTGVAATATTLAVVALHARYLDPTTPVLWGLVLAGTWAVVALAATADLAVRRPTDLAKDR